MTISNNAQSLTPVPSMSYDDAIKVLAEHLSTKLGPIALLEQDWRVWLETLYRSWISNKVGEIIPFGPHHTEFWNWCWSLRPGIKSRPFVGIWPRGGAKSTSAEMACVALGARSIKRYVLYVCATQEQADDHVANIGALLQSTQLAKYYPAMGERAVNKFGNSKGWRRNRLRTQSGFTVDAIGLDTAARGVKLEEDRPDLFVFDDIDGELDSPETTRKKILSLTKKLLPAGSADSDVLAIQNLVIPDGIFARLANAEGAQEADFLRDRIVSGPIPAIVDAEIVKDGTTGKRYLVGGTPAWVGQDIDKCQEQISEWGFSAWVSEAQHEVNVPSEGLFIDIDFDAIHVLPADVPELVRTVVWVDPAITATDHSDSHGINCDGLGVDDIIYRLRSWEGRVAPDKSLRRAIEWAIQYGADHVGVETDQGGDLWEAEYTNVYWSMIEDYTLYTLFPHIFLKGVIDKYVAGKPEERAIARTALERLKPNYTSEKAGGGFGPKSQRAARMHVYYTESKFRHVLGTHKILESALLRFPVRKPYDLCDAAFWSWNDLVGGTPIGMGATSDVPSTYYSVLAENPSTTAPTQSVADVAPNVETTHSLFTNHRSRVNRLWQTSVNGPSHNVAPRTLWRSMRYSDEPDTTTPTTPIPGEPVKEVPLDDTTKPG